MTLFFLASAAFFVALGMTALLTPAVREASVRRGWTDPPDGVRKLHHAETPSIGGVAIFSGITAAVVLIAWAAPALGFPGLDLHPAVYLGAVLITAVGAYDDVRDLGFKSKLAVEVVIACALLYSGYRVDLTGLPLLDGAYSEALYSVPLTVLWVVGVINAVNLIDGVDGLAAGVVAIGFASLAVAFGLLGDVPLVLVAVAVVGALVGFLIHNFNPATVFMGDSGSLLLGYAIAVYSLAGSADAVSPFAPLVPVIALGLPLLDTALSMVRRVMEKRSITAPDHDHIHHRMIARMPVRRAVLALYGVAGVFGAAAVAAAVVTTSTGVFWAVLVAALVAAALLFRLGYVRLPYAPPRLLDATGPERGPLLRGDGVPAERSTEVRPVDDGPGHAVPSRSGEEPHEPSLSFRPGPAHA
jgi:UDP-GlcNAc:undecaprenyl-phosphate GlcNAc-1-phosphate transferase